MQFVSKWRGRRGWRCNSDAIDIAVVESVVPLDESYLRISSMIVCERNVRIISAKQAEARRETHSSCHPCSCLFCLSDSVFSTAWLTSLSWKCVRSCSDNRAMCCHRFKIIVENGPIMPYSRWMKTGKILRHATCCLWQDNCFEKLTVSSGIFSWKNESMIMSRKKLFLF